MAADTYIRRYPFKLYPNAGQSETMDRMRRLHCALYNATLQERIDQWRHEVERHGRKAAKGLTCYDQQKAIKIIRRDDPEFAAMCSASLIKTLERVDLAFKAFFRRARQGMGRQSGYPRFKASALYPGWGHKKHGSGWRLDIQGGKGKLYIKGVPGLVKVRGKLPREAETFRTCELTYRAGTWWLSLVVEFASRELPKGERKGEVRFDLVDSFAVVRTANGGCAAGPAETVYAAAKGRIIPIYPGLDGRSDTESPDSGADRRVRVTSSTFGQDTESPDSGADRRFPLAWSIRLRDTESPDSGIIKNIQQAMARCKRGSNRYCKLRRRKARIEAANARRRREALHIWTTMLADSFGELSAVKPASISETVKSGRGDARDWGAQVETKAKLNRHVLDQAPALAIQMLEYKLEERGASFAVIDDDEAPSAVGNEIVTASKTNRKLKRKAA